MAGTKGLPAKNPLAAHAKKLLASQQYKSQQASSMPRYLPEYRLRNPANRNGNKIAPEYDLSVRLCRVIHHHFILALVESSPTQAGGARLVV